MVLKTFNQNNWCKSLKSINWPAQIENLQKSPNILIAIKQPNKQSKLIVN